MKNLLRDGVDGDFGRLTQVYVYDVSLIYLHFGSDYRHVGERHERAAERILNADDHRLTFTNW